MLKRVERSHTSKFVTILRLFLNMNCNAKKISCYLRFLEDPIEVVHLPCKQNSRHLSFISCDSFLQQTYSKCISAMLQFILPKRKCSFRSIKVVNAITVISQPFFFIFVVFSDFLVMHLQELVRMVFIAATAICDQLKLAGLSTLQVY